MLFSRPVLHLPSKPHLIRYLELTLSALAVFLFTANCNVQASQALAKEHSQVDKAPSPVGAIRVATRNINLPHAKWRSLTTEHFEIVFYPELKQQAIIVAKKAELIYKDLTQWFGPQWEPKKVYIVLNDSAEITNALTSPFPYSLIELYLTPPDTLPLLDNSGWLETVLVHELTHVFHLDMAEGFWLHMRKLIGRSPYTFPNYGSTPWIIEGIAVFKESEDGITGRGNTGFFDHVMQLEVSNHILPVDEITYYKNSPVFPADKIYYYGYFFLKFIEQNYGGSSAVLKYVTAMNDDIIPFNINSQAESVNRQSIFQLWDEYTQWLKKKFQPSITAFEQNPLPEAKTLQSNPIFNVSPTPDHQGGYYFIFNDGHDLTKIIHHTQGENKVLIVAPNVAQIDYHPRTGIIAIFPTVCENRNYHYDLYRYDLNQEDWIQLTTCARTKQMRIDPSGEKIAVVTNDRQGQQLLLYDLEGNILQVIQKMDIFSIFGRPFWRDATRIIVPLKPKNQSWDLYQFTLTDPPSTNATSTEKQDLASPLNAELITNDGTIYTSPFVDENQRLYAVTNHFNQWSVRYLHDGEWRQFYKNMGPTIEANLLSGTEVITVERAYNSNIITSMVVEKPTQKSTIPIKQETPNQLLETYPIADSSLTFNIEDYSTYKSLGGYFDTVGSNFFLSEAQMRFFYANYTAKDLLSHFLLDIQPILYQFPDHDLNDWGLVVSGSYTDSVNISYRRYLLQQEYFSESRALNVSLTEAMSIRRFWPIYQESYYRSFFVGGKWERIEYQQLNLGDRSTYETTTDIATEVGFSWDDSHQERYNVTNQAGRNLFVHLTNYDTIIPNRENNGNVFTIDWTEYFHLGRSHALTIQSFQGIRNDIGTASKKFHSGGFFFEPLFATGKSNIALPGYFANSQSGTRFHRMQFAWGFPLLSVYRGWVGLPPIGLNDIIGRVAYLNGATWNAHENKRDYRDSLLFSLDADFTFLFYNGLHLSFNYMYGLDDAGIEAFNLELLLFSF